jgi:hypothetical protein
MGDNVILHVTPDCITPRTIVPGQDPKPGQKLTGVSNRTLASQSAGGQRWPALAREMCLCRWTNTIEPRDPPLPRPGVCPHKQSRHFLTVRALFRSEGLDNLYANSCTQPGKALSVLENGLGTSRTRRLKEISQEPEQRMGRIISSPSAPRHTFLFVQSVTTMSRYIFGCGYDACFVG